ncbi:MAG: pseudaminic acid synthase [Gammaproteobacteria bacterium]|nr:pseudaminic acid synthase [Gammaproteobacteria bacterium]
MTRDAWAPSSEREPFIIAEMSGNHNGSLERAMQIVEMVAQSGAHALKLQTYTADTMTIESDRDDFRISDPDSLWDGYTLYDLYAKASTPWEWHEPVFKRCRELGMVCFSSPFDATAVDFLESLDAPMYKIASFECRDTNLIRKVAQTGKPVIISTGMASISEINLALETAREGGCSDVTLLKCTSSYPAGNPDSNLRSIPAMRSMFGVPVGLSDHTPGIGAAVASVALGAVAIEKHVTLGRADGGVDSEFSLEPQELASLVKESRAAWQSLGKVNFGASDAEKGSLVFRRSLYVVEDMEEGETLTPRNLRAIRPGYGLSPEYLEVFLGKRVSRPVPKGTPVSWDIIG